MRFLLGGIVAILWAIYNKEKFQIHKREILPLLGVGALFSIQLGFMNVGQNFTSGGHGVIMITTFPLWSSIFSHIFVPNDKLTKLKNFRDDYCLWRNHNFILGIIKRLKK